MDVKQLNFKHHQQAPLFFESLSFSLEKGKMHALSGKNGTGKSVLLNILNGKQPSSSILSGEIVNRGSSFLINQRFDQMIADQFTFEDNLQFARMHRFPSIFSGMPYYDNCSRFIDVFQIDVSLPVYKLSGGQRQILALMMVLQKSVDLLLLDEPTATLDEQNAKLVFEFLRSLTQNNMTLLIVCHDDELIDNYIDGQHLYLEAASSGVRHLFYK